MVENYEPNDPCSSRVFVNGTRIPAKTVDVFLRKEGPLDINRYAEVDFASPWSGEDYLSVFNSLSEDATKPDTLRIDCRNEDAEAYNTLFNGIVTGIGDTEDSNRKIHHCRSQGPEHYLDKIPASKAYNRGVSIKDILEFVSTELSNNFALTVTVEESISEDINNTVGIVDVPSFVISLVGLFEDVDNLSTPKTFQANKHTLANIIAWSRDKLGGRVWIQPTKNGATFIFTQNITSQSQTHRAHYLDKGETRIINNTALKNIKPLNTIILNGKASNTFYEIGDFELNRPADKFTQAKARHDILYQRNGKKELTETIRKSDSESKDEVIAEAKSILKKKVDEATTGSMKVAHDRFIQPFDTIEARPTINGQSNEVPPLTYEVHRCQYHANRNDDMIPYIDLNCGIHTDIEEDISVTTNNLEA